MVNVEKTKPVESFDYEKNHDLWNTRNNLLNVLSLHEQAKFDRIRLDDPSGEPKYYDVFNHENENLIMERYPNASIEDLYSILDVLEFSNPENLKLFFEEYSDIKISDLNSIVNVLRFENPQNLKFIFQKYNWIPFEYLESVLHTLQSADPQSLKNIFDKNPNLSYNELINLQTKSMDIPDSKLKAFFKFFDNVHALKDTYKNISDTDLLKVWQGHWLTPEACDFCMNIKNTYGIIVLWDDFWILDSFGKVMWTSYNWNSLWQFVIVRDRNSINSRPGRVKHESIHSKQLNPIWWIISLPSLLHELSKLKWLVPWAMDYATDNQITDRETYINQYKDNPLWEIKPLSFLQYFNKNVKNNSIKEHMQSDIDELEQYIARLKQEIDWISDIEWDDSKTFDKEEYLSKLTYLLEQKEKDLKAMKKLQEEHDLSENWHQFITFWEKDGYKYQNTPEKRQTNFQSEIAFRKQIVIDMFITHFGDKADNYKRWVSLYNKYKPHIDEIMDEYIKDKKKRKLQSSMNTLFKEIEKLEWLD